MSGALTLTLAEARAYAAEILTANKASRPNADAVAYALVAAEADGLGGHGLSRLPTYAAQARAGKINGFAVPELTAKKPCVLTVDAGHGFAFPALNLAITELSDVTRSEGLAAAAIRRSHHCGAMGHHVERLAREGLCALMFANTPAAMAAWGGRTAVYGTNPIAFAAPLAGRDPIVVDLSLSKVARGNIMAAKQKGAAIPEGWAFDAEGRPTTDPAAALAGTMAPLGDAKGTALALMVEILAVGLTGAVLSRDAASFLDAKGGPPSTGQLFIAFDPNAFSDAFGDRVSALAAAIESDGGARLPGSRRYVNRARAAREGVTLSEGLQKEIAAL